MAFTLHSVLFKTAVAPAHVVAAYKAMGENAAQSPAFATAGAGGGLAGGLLGLGVGALGGGALGYLGGRLTAPEDEVKRRRHIALSTLLGAIPLGAGAAYMGANKGSEMAREHLWGNISPLPVRMADYNNRAAVDKGFDVATATSRQGQPGVLGALAKMDMDTLADTGAWVKNLFR